MKKIDYLISLRISCLTVMLAGCASDSVVIPIKDHAYVAYARKVMGKDGTREIEDGPHYEFYSNQRTKFSYFVKDGKLNGVATTWSNDGQMTSRLLYKDDVVVKDLLEEAKKDGTGIYKVKVATNRPGVKKVETKMDKERASKAVKDVTSEVTSKSVESVNVKTNAVQPINKRSGSAVKKLNSNPAVF